MAENGLSSARLRRIALVWADVLGYAIVVSVATVSGAVILSIATGGRLARANVFVFVIGWFQLAYATFLLWPSSPEELDASPGPHELGSSTRFQSISRSLPPFRWLPLPPREARMGISGQLFVAALFVLGVSFVAEMWLGIG